MQILKLGGSVVTNKNKNLSANINNISRLSKEIAKAKPKKLIIVHGGGSFGHPIAKKYSILEGYTDFHQLIGFSKTRQAMIKLNDIIIENLLSENVPAVSVNASSLIVTDKKRITSTNFKIIEKLVKQGFIPVLYGDAVIDSSQVFTILSGDQLIVSIASQMGVKKIILGSDVDGVFSSDPKVNENAILKDTLSVTEINSLNINKSLNTDVTGGMLGKILEARIAVDMGIKVIILNANKPNRVYKALKGKPVLGTILKR
jgi:isopentenyl phosphate kinase